MKQNIQDKADANQMKAALLKRSIERHERLCLQAFYLLNSFLSKWFFEPYHKTEQSKNQQILDSNKTKQKKITKKDTFFLSASPNGTGHRGFQIVSTFIF